MQAHRETIINGTKSVKIQEYLWEGKIKCYVDNKLSDKTYDENVALLSGNNGHETALRDIVACYEGMEPGQNRDVAMYVIAKQSLDDPCVRFATTEDKGANVKTVRDVVIKYLRENKYDGLVCPGECGCEIKDLAPCGGEGIIDCKPAYRGNCTCAEGCKWDMYETMAAAQKSKVKK